jgi:hypothetical protein
MAHTEFCVVVDAEYEYSTSQIHSMQLRRPSAPCVLACYSCGSI